MKTIIVLFLLLTATAQAEQMCFREAAHQYGLNELVLQAIAHTESRFNPHAISPPNQNGSYDIGVMQINSDWLPVLSRYGIAKEHLLQACTNIYVGAWILRQNVNTYGNTTAAIAHYNSPNAQAQKRYLARIAQSITYVSLHGPRAPLHSEKPLPSTPTFYVPQTPED